MIITLERNYIANLCNVKCYKRTIQERRSKNNKIGNRETKQNIYIYIFSVRFVSRFSSLCSVVFHLPFAAYHNAHCTVDARSVNILWPRMETDQHKQRFNRNVINTNWRICGVGSASRYIFCVSEERRAKGILLIKSNARAGLRFVRFVCSICCLPFAVRCFALRRHSAHLTCRESTRSSAFEKKKK